MLHDVFDVPFGEVADVVGRTPAAVRQLASRARRHVAQQRPRFEASPGEHERAVRAFARAVAEGDLDRLVAVLDPDVVWTSDGGGHATAARKPVHGAGRVARAWIALRRRAIGRAGGGRAQRQTGPVIPGTDRHRAALSFVVDGGRIARIDPVRNPEKLRHVAYQAAGA